MCHNVYSSRSCQAIFQEIKIYSGKDKPEPEEGAVGINHEALYVDTSEDKELTRCDSGYTTVSPEYLENDLDTIEQSNQVLLSFAAVHKHNLRQQTAEERHEFTRSSSVSSSKSRVSVDGSSGQDPDKYIHRTELQKETQETKNLHSAGIARFLSQNSHEPGYFSGYEGCCDSDVEDKSTASKLLMKLNERNETGNKSTPKNTIRRARPSISDESFPSSGQGTFCRQFKNQGKVEPVNYTCKFKANLNTFDESTG